MKLPVRLRDVTGRLNTTLGHLVKELLNGADKSSEILSLLHSRMHYVSDMAAFALKNYERLLVTICVKRGLIDGIGKLSRMFFETTMNDDVEELRNTYNQLMTLAKANNKTINLNCRNIVRLENEVTELSFYTNLLGSSVNVMLTKLDALYEHTIIGHSLSGAGKRSHLNVG